MKSTTLITFLFILLLLLIFFVTNPKEYQLKKHLKETFKEEAFEEGGLSGAIKELLAGPEAWLMSLNTERHNLIFFSVYEVEGLSKKHVYIGALNSFVELPN